MPLNVRRLRLWLAISAVVVIAVVAGFLAYGRYRVRKIVRAIPQKLGANIQQTANGFTYSQSEGGRTLFTIHASQMVQFKSGGRAELKDVNIIVYGRNSSRFDQIYGSGFEYDPQEKIVRATGEVHIDLQADAEGVQHPDQAPPQELKNPVHVKTSGLEFNEKTGIAQTNEDVEFRTPQASGSAKGAVYDTHQRTLTLKSDVRLVTQSASLPAGAGLSRRKSKSKQPPAAPAAPAEIQATSAVLRNESRTATLEGVTAKRGTESLRARNVVLALRDDSTIERIVATGDVQGSDTGPGAASFKAAKLEMLFNGSSELATAELSGGASYEARGKRPMRGSAERMLAKFGPRNTLLNVHAADHVDLVQEPSVTAPKRAPSTKSDMNEVQQVEVKAAALDLFTREGRSIDHAVAGGGSQIILTQAANGQPRKPAPGAAEGANRQFTTISAPQLNAAFDDQNHLRTVHGTSDSSAPVKIVASSTSAGQPDRVTTSKIIDAVFVPGKTAAISSIVQSGDFHYAEGARNATAEQARFTAATNALLLSGNPRYSDDQLQLTSDSLTLNRTSGEIHASGDVKASYLPQTSAQTKSTNNAMFSGTNPIHVTARDLVAQRSTGIANFTGGARMWEGANLVEAPAIRFDGDRRSLDATAQNGQQVQSVFVQNGQSGKTVPVNVMAARLTYRGTENRARFEGGVTIRSADSTLTADHVDVVLKSSAAGAAGTQSKSQIAGSAGQALSGPAEIDRIIAQGNVTIVQPGRKARGQQLLYVAAEQSFKLTGGPPSIFDAERGQITGNSLTFFSSDDRVLIENPANNGGATKTVIHTRITK